MSTSLIQQAQIVKEKLIEFGKTTFQKEYSKGLEMLQASMGSQLSEEAIFAYTDWFVLESLLKNNRRVLSFFIEQCKNDADILIAKQWYHVIYGIFHVKEVLDRNRFEVLNLVNNVIYRVTTTVKTPLPLKKGEYMMAKIIPLENFHLFTGLIEKLATKKKEEIYQIVLEIQLNNPKMAFIDNLQRLEQAYKIQEDEYDDFVTFFGSDEIVLSGQEVAEKPKGLPAHHPDAEIF